MSMNNQSVDKNYKLIQYLSSKIGYKLNKEDREDLVNDTIVKLLQSQEEIRQEEVSAYVSKVMQNVLIDRGRTDNTDALNHSVSLDKPIDESEGSDNTFTLHDVVPDKKVSHYGKLYRDDINDLCSKLPPRQAELFDMRYYQGLTQQEIVDITGLTADNVDVTLRRAVKSAYELIDRGKE